MTTKNTPTSNHRADPDTESAGYALQVEIDTQPDPKTTLIDYSGLDFKEMLAACPIDDIDLARNPEPPRPVEL